MLYEGVSISKGGVVDLTKRTVNLADPASEEMSLSGGEGMITWLRKWNHCDQ